MDVQGAGEFARIELNRLDTTEFIYAQLTKKIYRALPWTNNYGVPALC
jgi:hypothetical protein